MWRRCGRRSLAEWRFVPKWGGPTRATDITCVSMSMGADARRVEHPHFISQVVDDRQGFLDSDPPCLAKRKSCRIFPLADSRASGLARPDAGRMRCPTETLGEGKGGRTPGKGRETATV